VIYRRTENTVRRLASRRQAILAAASDVASEKGIGAVQIVSIANRAGIADGSVYRYFPSKTDLVAALASAFCEQELAAMEAAATAAPGPLSALAAAIATFAMRAVTRRRLTFALLAEPAEPDLDEARASFRHALIGAFRTLITRAVEDGHLRDPDPALLAPALMGALIDGLVGPVVIVPEDPAKARAHVQQLTLFALRGLGLGDARARGLVAHIPLDRVFP
jgi:AcrR family transcriptional regulator